MSDRSSPENDPWACSLCGCYIGQFAGDYCEACERDLGIKPPMRRCVACGQRGPEEQMAPVDVSPPDDYYPTFEFLCRSCEREEIADG